MAKKNFYDVLRDIKDSFGLKKGYVEGAVLETARDAADLAKYSFKRGDYRSAVDHYETAAEACKMAPGGKLKKQAKAYRTKAQQIRKKHIKPSKLEKMFGLLFLVVGIFMGFSARVFTGNIIGGINYIESFVGAGLFFIGLFLLVKK